MTNEMGKEVDEGNEVPDKTGVPGSRQPGFPEQLDTDPYFDEYDLYQVNDSFDDAFKEAPKIKRMRRQVFVDPVEMKAKIRAAAVRPLYNVSMYYHQTGIAQWTAVQPWFEQLTLAVIGVNALWLWVDVDLNTAPTLVSAHPVFLVMENLFAAFYTIEWAIRFLAFRRKVNIFRDAWMCFDTLLVLLMAAETWGLSLYIMLVASSADLGGNTYVLKLARLMRLSRMARMARLLRMLPEIQIMVKGLGAAMRSVIFTLLLLAILLYIFGICFKNVVEGTQVGEAYFSSVFQSVHTLLLHGTLLDEAADVVDALGDESFLLVLLFYVFVLLAALTVLNMLIGVLCEIVSGVSATERETIAVAFVRDTLLRVLDQCGMTKGVDDTISKAEFLQILANEEATKKLYACGVDVYAIVDATDFIFQPEPGGISERSLSFLDFLDLILALRGTNIATVKDIVDLRKQLKSTFERLKSKQLAKSRAYTTLRQVPEEDGGPAVRRSPTNRAFPARQTPPGRARSRTASAAQDANRTLVDLIRSLAQVKAELAEFRKQAAPLLSDDANADLQDEMLILDSGNLRSQAGHSFQGPGQPEEAWSREALRKSDGALQELQRSVDGSLKLLLQKATSSKKSV